MIPQMKLRTMLMKSSRLIQVRGIALVFSLTLLSVLLAPALALADDAPEPYDARMLGYPSSVQLDGGGTALSWIVLVLLGVLTIAVLFKDAKRTHLD